MSRRRYSRCGTSLPATTRFCSVGSDATLSLHQRSSRADRQDDNASPVDAAADIRVDEALDARASSFISHTPERQDIAPQTQPLPAVIEDTQRITSSPDVPPLSPIGPVQWEHPDAFDQHEVEDMPARHGTWQKDVDLHPPAPVKHLPRPTPSRPTPVLLKIVKSRRIRPALFFWVSIAVIGILDFSGAFGMLVVLGRGNAESISLRVTPDRVVVGATITLRGTHFSPHGRIGLTRDASLPIVDTGGSIIAATDGNGNFTDTVIVGGWGSGRHILSAEDAVTHKIASFSITVSNQGELLMPPHLEVAQRSVP